MGLSFKFMLLLHEHRTKFRVASGHFLVLLETLFGYSEKIGIRHGLL